MHPSRARRASVLLTAEMCSPQCSATGSGVAQPPNSSAHATARATMTAQSRSLPIVDSPLAQRGLTARDVFLEIGARHVVARDHASAACNWLAHILGRPEDVEGESRGFGVASDVDL